MSYPINYPTPQGADIQIFSAPDTNVNDSTKHGKSWVKPQGASFVWFTLIGSGSGGGNAVTDGGGGLAGGGGGGSGAVTNCLVPAFLIPDTLRILVGNGGGSAGSGRDTIVQYKGSGTDFYELLTAKSGSAGANASSTGGADNFGNGGAGGTVKLSTYFSAAGFYQSIAGDSGANGNVAKTVSSTTFLSGGTGGDASASASPYGYSKANTSTAALSGYSIIQPIINSISANSTGSTYTSEAAARVVYSGFGSGGSGASTVGTPTVYGSKGGPGLVVIISW